MARSKNARSNSDRGVRYVRYAIPFVAILALAVTLTILTLPAPSAHAAMDFTFQLVLQESNKDNTRVGGLLPTNAIGEAGGLWNTTKLNSYGIDASHYPIYMDSPQLACPGAVPPCTIHVKSKVVYDYTLGDLFQVWGMPLGINDTLNVHSSGNFAWQLCIGANPQTATYSNLWGNLVLKRDMQLVLFYTDYSQSGCAPI